MDNKTKYVAEFDERMAKSELSKQEEKKRLIREEIEDLTDNRRMIAETAYSVTRMLVKCRDTINKLDALCRANKANTDSILIDDCYYCSTIEDLIKLADKADSLCEYQIDDLECDLSELESQQKETDGEAKASTMSEWSETNLRLYQVGDESMSPLYRIGDMLLIRHVNNPTFFQYGEAYEVDGCIRKLCPDPDNEDNIILSAINPDYPPTKLPRSGIQDAGLVVGTARGSILVEHLKN